MPASSRSQIGYMTATNLLNPSVSGSVDRGVDLKHPGGEAHRDGDDRRVDERAQIDARGPRPRRNRERRPDEGVAEQVERIGPGRERVLVGALVEAPDHVRDRPRKEGRGKRPPRAGSIGPVQVDADEDRDAGRRLDAGVHDRVEGDAVARDQRVREADEHRCNERQPPALLEARLSSRRLRAAGCDRHGPIISPLESFVRPPQWANVASARPPSKADSWRVGGERACARDVAPHGALSGEAAERRPGRPPGLCCYARRLYDRQRAPGPRAPPRHGRAGLQPRS